MNPIKKKKKIKSAVWMTAISKMPKYLFLEYVKILNFSFHRAHLKIAEWSKN